MAEIGLAVVQTLFAALQCSELKDICSHWGYKSKLDELKQTVTTVKGVLRDAETKMLSNEEQEYIKELKDVVYETDDLFDEFVTRLELKQFQVSKRGEFYEKVRLFFSYSMFKKVKEIKTKLIPIVDNHKRFALDVDYKPICRRREETCSYVYVKDIIGRDDDKKVVVKMLLESKNQDVGFMTVVGLGGVGKTALAQLVYNDEDVQSKFGDLRFWVCVSDQDKQELDVKVILSKILKLVTNGQRSFDGFELEQLRQEFPKVLGGKKYMLVLDDVWNEDRKKWVELRDILKVGARGSMVLVTTRSEMTAIVVGDRDHTYMLQGLSSDNSWDLFQSVAFNEGNYQQKEFMDVGKKIVAKCCNIPLAIKVVGSLLYGRDIEEWERLEKIGLSKMKKGDNKIMSVLQLSYYNLDSPLKSCFTYCAVFPKDYTIPKKRLIYYWMAQGYIVPDEQGQSIADVAEDYFLILLRRCFFQDVVKDEDGHIVLVKIHDFMHDVAQEMAGKEIQICGNSIGDEVRHWSYIGKNHFPISSITTKLLRSYVCLDNVSVMPDWSSPLVLKQLKCLRVLELKNINDIKLLESIADLLHLRYLAFSKIPFQAFGSSITKLRNLQTFNLRHCGSLSELPQDFSKLEKLVHIEIINCNSLRTMPPSLSKLPYLKSLVLTHLMTLQYMEKKSSFAGSEETPFFPSLDYLRIMCADELKGWFGAEVDQCQSIRGFPCLSRLEISHCSRLATFPPCPVVRALRCHKLGIVKQVVGKGNGTSCLATLTLSFGRIVELEDDIVPWEALNKSLHTLIFWYCQFKSLPKGMHHLTFLRTLKILACSHFNALPRAVSLVRRCFCNCNLN